MANWDIGTYSSIQDILRGESLFARYISPYSQEVRSSCELFIDDRNATGKLLVRQQKIFRFEDTELTLRSSVVTALLGT